MKSYNTVIFFFAIYLFLSYNNHFTIAKKNDHHPKIIGGNIADETQFPYQVSLRIKNRHFCGGSILNHRWILTAAHCLRGFNDTAINVVTGTTKLDEGGDFYQSSRVIGHEKYNSLFIWHDIGLIYVDEDIQFSETVKPVDLPSENFKKSNYPAVLSGWGTTSYPGKAPNDLQFIILTVINQKQCRNVSIRVTDKNICTLNKKGEGACHGDSGGPLVADGVQIGVVSWGTPCAKGKPDVFTRVYSYIDWINEHIRTRLGERMVSMSSMLVETVSINYEDFNESFLTCGTCLCVYDGSEHTPKLLPCSHTVCLHCLTRIAASQTREAGAFRCPICRELITIPRGGVPALPPSFLVNQLLDLMSRQRREVIPKCSVHTNQELLFCETCDTVFCTVCTGGNHAETSPGCTEHTIIPFSIAIKRMSEILLYKANECISKLTQAQESVNTELRRLETAMERCLTIVDTEFTEIIAKVERRRVELQAAIAAAARDKKRVLEEQHALIEAEKNKVERECEGLQYQVEVRNITQRIGSLTDQLDAAVALSEPRENAFITAEFGHNSAIKELEKALETLGRVRSSTTLPGLCRAQLKDTAIAKLLTTVILETVDYHGHPRNAGGDPIGVELTLTDTQSEDQIIETEIKDLENGTYEVRFRPPSASGYALKLTVFERPIKDYPIFFTASEHNEPIKSYGKRGHGKDEFLQPVAVAVDDDNMIYVVDSGNSRIKVLDSDMEFQRHIINEGLEGRSCTGIAISDQGLVVVNWRTRTITEMSTFGDTIRSFTHNTFQEPIDVAVDRSYGHILVADNGQSCVFVFDSDGKVLFQVGKKGMFKLISSVTVGPAGEILVADSKIQVFSAKGDFSEEIYPEENGKGKYGGIAVDADGKIIASRSDKGRSSIIQVLKLGERSILTEIDSHSSKLRRPMGIAVLPNNHLVVVDLGNDCIKKYRYW
ncbi:tripartite motif-containing protein 2-like [Chelonus insularis]|uniref:tripartite motif-containing protein 2-like n=1 Tax=Chelonus insularis TaxID=460826 RepID=UPI001589E661|nr:tripartite motif-containing protein 2-like [Chelonus insularis]